MVGDVERPASPIRGGRRARHGGPLRRRPVRVAREWYARGLGRDPDRPCTPLFADFAHGIEKARGDFVARRIRRIEQAAEGGTWTADAWAVERVDPDTWGRKDRLDVSGTMTVVEMRAFFTAVLQLVERYVPEERRDAEVQNLIAVTDELTRGIGGGAVDRPSLSRVK